MNYTLQAPLTPSLATATTATTSAVTATTAVDTEATTRSITDIYHVSEIIGNKNEQPRNTSLPKHLNMTAILYTNTEAYANSYNAIFT